MVWAVLLSVISGASAAPLTFKDCVELVAMSNPDLLAAEAQLRAQEEATRGSYSAFFPTVNASMAALQTRPKGAYDPKYTSGLSLSYNLFSGLRDRSKVRQAAANLEIAQANLDLVRAKVSAGLRQAFAQYLFARDNVALTAVIRDRREQNERLVRAQYEAGRENQGSYLLSKTLLEQAAYENRVARDQLVIAAQNLAHVVGIDSLDFEGTGTIPSEDPPASAKAEDLLPLTPTHRIQTGKLNLAEATNSVSLSGFLPSLDLSGSLSYTGAKPTIEDNRQLSAGLTLTVPLFSGLSTYRDYRSTRESITGSEQTRVSVDFDTLTQLRQNLFSYQQSIQKLKVDLDILDAATIRATIARKRYNTGILMFEQWDIIESDLINRQKNALNSRRDRAIAEANYRQTTGTGDLP